MGNIKIIFFHFTILILVTRYYQAALADSEAERLLRLPGFFLRLFELYCLVDLSYLFSLAFRR